MRGPPRPFGRSRESDRRAESWRPLARDAAARRPAKTLVEIAVEATQEGWAGAVAGKATDVLGEDLWGEIRATGASGCDPLAEMARAILEAKKQAHELVADFLVGEPPAQRAAWYL